MLAPSSSFVGHAAVFSSSIFFFPQTYFFNFFSFRFVFIVFACLTNILPPLDNERKAKQTLRMAPKQQNFIIIKSESARPASEKCFSRCSRGSPSSEGKPAGTGGGAIATEPLLAFRSLLLGGNFIIFALHVMWVRVFLSYFFPSFFLSPAYRWVTHFRLCSAWEAS